MPTRHATVVFVDLSGSTGLFEALGNERATEVVTKLTQWITRSCEQHQGRVVKLLGDGVLALFASNTHAVQACVVMQRQHTERLIRWPISSRAHLQIGLASGEVVEVDADCYGDAVNVAARLSDMSGAGQILANALAVAQLPELVDVRLLSLGDVVVRGKAEPQPLYRIDWTPTTSDMMTVPSGLETLPLTPDSMMGAIHLSWLDTQNLYYANDGPVVIGREDSCDFIINDTRVSRRHARIDWNSTPSGGHFVLSDTSSFGTWVRLVTGGPEVELRRSACPLSDSGEIALGAPFSDFTVPTVSFSLGAGGRADVNSR